MAAQGDCALRTAGALCLGSALLRSFACLVALFEAPKGVGESSAL